MILMNQPPNDIRFFVHGRIKRAVGGFIKSGFNPISAATSFLAPAPQRPIPRPRAGGVPSTRQVFSVRPPGLRASNRSIIRQAREFRDTSFKRHFQLPSRRPPPRTTTARPSAFSAAEKEAGRRLKFGPEQIGDIIDIVTGGGSQQDCGPFRVWDEVKGKCVFGLGEQAGRDDTPGGDVVMGRYGAGEMPGNMVVNRAVCRPGMVIGDDGVCYNRSQIKNSEREWPRGRRPLLTGGDMRAIATAARAGKRLERTTKRLQKIGMMKKPPPRAPRLPAHQHKITSGG